MSRRAKYEQKNRLCYESNKTTIINNCIGQGFIVCRNLCFHMERQRALVRCVINRRPEQTPSEFTVQWWLTVMTEDITKGDLPYKRRHVPRTEN